MRDDTRSPRYSRVIVSITLRSRRITSHQLPATRRAKIEFADVRTLLAQLGMTLTNTKRRQPIENSEPSRSRSSA